MRHQKNRHKLGRTASHRRATLAALASALIEHKRIETTLAKAKALREYIEPLITRAKDDSTHSRREVFRHLHSKEAVKELFGEVSAQVGDRPGGYTRIVKLGLRQGDNAEMAMIELVDWNDVRPEGGSSSRKRTRRSRRGSSSAPNQPTASGPSKAAGSSNPADASDHPVAKGTSTQSHDAPAVAANPEVNEHPDHPQGAAPGTGEPQPEAGKGDQGAAGGSRHRG